MGSPAPDITLDEVTVTAKAPVAPAPAPAPLPAALPGAPVADVITIKVGGQVLGGWTSARVIRGVERLPSGIALEFTELAAAYAAIAASPAGSPIQVYLGADLILTGYVDVYWPHEDAGTHVVRMEARSKTEDLVDCSLTENPPPPWAVIGGSIGQWATTISKPFGISVVQPDGDATLPATATFPINPGMTCAQLLEEIARTVQMLMWDDPQGRLVISKVGTTRAGSTLVEGINCETGEARLSMDQRYSEIRVVGQNENKTTHHFDIFATARDPDVPRFRPKLIVMDVPGQDNTMEWAQQRADWEVKRRIARSRVVDVLVTGWRDQAGKLWSPNTITKCTLPNLKIAGEDMLIAECGWFQGEAGTGTLLTLMPPEGFTPEPFHKIGLYPDANQPGNPNASSTNPPSSQSTDNTPGI